MKKMNLFANDVSKLVHFLWLMNQTKLMLRPEEYGKPYHIFETFFLNQTILNKSASLFPASPTH